MNYYVEWLVVSIIAAFPALTIVLHNAGNACLLFLLLCSVIAGTLRYKPAGFSFSQVLKAYWPLHTAMAAWFFAVLLNQISRAQFSDAPFDRTLRLALFAPVFWISLTPPFRRLRVIQWSFIVGTLIAAIKAYIVTNGGSTRPSNIGFLPIIAVSNLTLLLGSMALVSIGWNKRQEKLFISLKILAFCVALYVAVLTGTRGGWITLPAIFAFAFIFFAEIRVRHKSIITAAVLILLVGTFSASSTVKARFSAAQADITQFEHGNPDTSLGLRLQLWQGSWILFKEHPVFGVGRENFKTELMKLSSRKIITPAAAEVVHSHNELLFNMAVSGTFGLIAILSIYCVPAFYFARDIHNNDPQIKTAAGLGLLLCLCFFFYGLVDLMFFWNAAGSFYCMSVAVFLACIIKRKEELRQN